MLSSIPLTFASFIYRKSATEQHSNGKCHLPPTRSSGWNSSRSSRATCHSKSRRAALQQIVRLFPIEARAGTDAGCVASSLFGLFRFSLFAVFNLSLKAKVAKLVPCLTRLILASFLAPRLLLDGMLFARWVASVGYLSFGLLLSLKSHRGREMQCQAYVSFNIFLAEITLFRIQMWKT